MLPSPGVQLAGLGMFMLFADSISSVTQTQPRCAVVYSFHVLRLHCCVGPPALAGCRLDVKWFVEELKGSTGFVWLISRKSLIALP